MKSKKIGLLTFHKEQNYGAVLQAYSLQKVIESMGYCTEFLDWNETFHRKSTKKSRAKEIYHFFSNYGLSLKKYVRNKELVARTKKSFCSFLYTKLIIGKEPLYDEYDLSKIVDNYSGFIAGSDMVWTDIGQNLDTFFLRFAPFEKRASYAPSLTGVSALSYEKKERLKNYLKGIRYLSFREQEAVDFAKNEINATSNLVVDPTLLHTKEEWTSLLKIQTGAKEKYILCYMFGGVDKRLNRRVKRLAKDKGLKVRYVPMVSRDYSRESDNGYEAVYGPTEFVDLFFNASFVVTNSFHGLLFSLISNVPFVVMQREEKNKWKTNEGRITNMLRQIGEEHRLIASPREIKHEAFDINYQSINKVINELREQSKAYLHKMLLGIANNISEPNEKVDSKNISFLTKKECISCGVCAEMCSANAILMNEDSEGFFYPSIDSAKCVDCGVCSKLCPSINARELRDPVRTLFGFAKELQQKKSASGGAFYSIAKSFIFKEKGFVFGASLDNDTKKVRHICVDKEEDLVKLQGSKYVQSNIGDSYQKIRLLLKNKKKVLFSGTPCQVAGLYAFLGRDFENLFTIDLVCHGVPSEKLWLKQMIELETQGKISDFYFRSKLQEETNRSAFVANYYQNGKQTFRPYNKLPYYYLFINNASFRFSCYYCAFACRKRIGDITLGDCDSWKRQVSFYPEKAKSIVLLNTTKSFDLWNLVDNFQCAELDYATECLENSTLLRPTQKPIVRETIYEDIYKNGWDKYMIRDTLLSKLARIIRQWLA